MVRHYYLVEKKSIKEICRVLNLSREPVRKIVRSETTAFTYERQVQPYPKLGPWITRLDKLLEENQEASEETAAADGPNLGSACA